MIKGKYKSVLSHPMPLRRSPFTLSNQEISSPDESPCEEKHASISRIRTRGRFLLNSILAIGISLFASDSLGAEKEEELPPKPTVEDPFEFPEMDPLTEVLEDMKALKKKFGSDINEPHQAREIAPVIQKYNDLLAGAGYDLPLKDIKDATELAILGLYYRKSKVEFTGRVLPANILELEATLIKCCRNIPEGANEKEIKKRNNLEDRLCRDIFWHQFYQEYLPLHNRAAELINDLYLPTEGKMTIGEYNDFLEKIPSGNKISWRSLLKSYQSISEIVEDSVEKFAELTPEERVEVFVQYRKLCKKLNGYKISDYGESDDELQIDKEQFNKWKTDKFYKPYGDMVERMSTLETTWKGRKELALSITEQMKHEKQLDEVFESICKMGLTPTDAIIGAPKTPKMGRGTTMFYNTYKGAMGSPAPARHYVHKNCTPKELGTCGENFRKNSASVFPYCLHSMCDMTEDGHDVNTLLIMTIHGMKEELKRMNKTPNMAEWGERAAIFYTFPHGLNKFYDDKDWNRAKARVLKEILVTGFNEVEYYDDKPKRVPGLFDTWKKNFPKSLPWLRESERENGRQEFIKAFLQVVPKHYFGTEDALIDWGFCEREILNAQLEN